MTCNAPSFQSIHIYYNTVYSILRRYLNMNLVNNDELKDMSVQELTAYRNKMSTRLHELKRQKSLRVTIYIQGKFRDSYETSLKWAFENKLIEKKTNWAFAKFAISHIIKMISDEIERERNATPEVTDIPIIPDEPYTAKSSL